MFLSVVAPCMNEELGLHEFYSRMISAIQEASVADYEIILVDDGSTDNTWDVMKVLHLGDRKVKGIRLSRNFGHQSALTAGLSEAKGDYIFIIDSDLQDPPELLSDMIRSLNSGFDVVYGQRRRRAGETVFKKVTASLFYRVLSKVADIDIPKDTGDFRLINRKVLKAYGELSESQRFTRGLIAWLGFKQMALPYDRHGRFAGTTKYPLMKMIHFSLDAVTGFSIKPLRHILYLGLIASGLSFLFFAYTIYGWIIRETNTLETILMASLLLFTSVQFVALGFIGEYVGRTFTESKRRPLFFVQEKTDALAVHPFVIEPSPVIEGHIQ